MSSPGVIVYRISSLRQERPPCGMRSTAKKKTKYVDVEGKVEGKSLDASFRCGFNPRKNGGSVP